MAAAGPAALGALASRQDYSSAADQKESKRREPFFRVAVAMAPKKKSKSGPTAQQVALWGLQCAALQRKIFPKCESLDIVAEAKKPHCQLFVALASGEGEDHRPGGEEVTPRRAAAPSGAGARGTSRGDGSCSCSGGGGGGAAKGPGRGGGRLCDAGAASAGAAIIVADHGGSGAENCIGFILVARTASTAYLSKVCVSDTCRRCGVGESLLLFVVAQLKQARCQAVHLHVCCRWPCNGRDWRLPHSLHGAGGSMCVCA
jgi:hypothetical protein